MSNRVTNYVLQLVVLRFRLIIISDGKLKTNQAFGENRKTFKKVIDCKIEKVFGVKLKQSS